MEKAAYPAGLRHHGRAVCGQDRRQKLDGLPFDCERRFASILVRHEEENLLIIKGSIDEVYLRCSNVEYKGQRHA